jgi:uncharacterized membrane protein YoaK (UPF0700 family)
VNHIKVSLPVLLSFNGGYVDTAGFLALQGLFTAHVTGNFVTLAAALAFGTSGVITKLLALPVFCAVVILTRVVSHGFPARNWAVLPTMLTVQVLLLVIGAVLAVNFGPFKNGDSGSAMVTGLILVAAMAIQNAVHRIHLGNTPPSTLMTGTTTQFMIDVADVIIGVPPDKREATRQRMRAMGAAMASFAMGAALAALLFHQVGTWCFVVAPIVGLATRVIAPR